MQEHHIFNLVAHLAAGYVFTDNVITFDKNIIGPGEGIIISHMRRIHLLTYIRSFPVGKMSNFRSKSSFALLYFCKCKQHLFYWKCVDAQANQSIHCLPQVISNKTS